MSFIVALPEECTITTKLKQRELKFVVLRVTAQVKDVEAGKAALKLTRGVLFNDENHEFIDADLTPEEDELLDRYERQEEHRSAFMLSLNRRALESLRR